MQRIEELLLEAEEKAFKEHKHLYPDAKPANIQKAFDDLKSKLNWLKTRNRLSEITSNDIFEIEDLYRKYAPIYNDAFNERKANEVEQIKQEALAFLEGGKSIKKVAPSTQPQSLTINEVYKKFCDQQNKAGLWRTKTYEGNVAVFKLFEEILDNKEFNTIDHSDTVKFKDTIAKIPPNYNKKSEFKDKSIAEIVHLDCAETLSIATLNKHLEKISALFEWAKPHGYCKENYAAKLKFKQPRKTKKARDKFSIDELNTIFSSAIYERGKFKKPYRFWLPLLALFTGARIEELAQLKPSDIKQEGKVWYLDINEEGDDTQLKTESSTRFVPLHDTLIEKGFIKFIERQAKLKEPRIFTELDKTAGKYSHSASKWFSAYKNKLGFGTDGKKTFHSLRHTFIDNLKQQRTEESIVSAIVGHSYDSMTFGYYGKDYGIKLLKEVVDSVEYEELKLGHIRW